VEAVQRILVLAAIPPRRIGPRPLPTRNLQRLARVAFPEGSEDALPFRSVGEGERSGFGREQKIERILFFQHQIQLEMKTQFICRSGKGAGRDAVVEDVAAEAHSRAFIGLELHPQNLSENIAPGKKPDFMGRKVDRRSVAVGCFVADAELHGAKLGQAVTFSHRPWAIFFLQAEVR